MSIQRVQAVLEKSRMKGSARLCLLAIADRAREDGFAWPGIDDIARRAGLSRRHASRGIAAAQRAGELYVHERRGYSHQYVVLVGQTWEEIYTALISRFGLGTTEIDEWLESRVGQAVTGDEMSGAAEPSLGEDPVVLSGDDKNGRGGMTRESRESLINPHLNNPQLTLNEQGSPLPQKGEAEDLWERCLQALDWDRDTPLRFKRLLERTRAAALEEGRLVLEAPGAYERDWLEARATRTLENLLRGFVKGELTVEFVVENEPPIKIDGRG